MIDNCLISDVDIRYSQNLLDDITLDPDWDLYQQNTDSSLCSSNSGGSGGMIFSEMNTVPAPLNGALDQWPPLG